MVKSPYRTPPPTTSRMRFITIPDSPKELLAKSLELKASRENNITCDDQNKKIDGGSATLERTANFEKDFIVVIIMW